MGTEQPETEKNAPAPKRKLNKLSVLMPVFNERWTLETIVQRVLAAPVPLQIELVVVDDGSSDGSWDELQRLAAREPRMLLLRHPTNLGKGAAIRTAIDAMTGEVAIVQDADLEYDPAEYGRLLQPILDDRADAVYGSRYAGGTRQIHAFWHTMANRVLTLISNVLFNLTLSDMETCYKMVRADVLKQLRLTSRTFTFEPELTARLVQWGARIHEVPISYAGRSFHEGKKIRPIDAAKAIGEMLRCRFLDTQFTFDSRAFARWRWAKARRCRRWVLQHIEPLVGQRVLEIGPVLAGGPMVLDRPRVVLVDEDVAWCDRMKRRYGHRGNVRVLTATGEEWSQRIEALLANTERDNEPLFDTVIFSGIADKPRRLSTLLPQLAAMLDDEGSCIMLLPDDPEACAGSDSNPLSANNTQGLSSDGVAQGVAEREGQAAGVAGKHMPRPVMSSAVAERPSSAKVLSNNSAWHAMFRAAGLEIVRIETVGRIASLLSQNDGMPPEIAARRAARIDAWLPAVQWLDRVAPGRGIFRLVIARKTRRLPTAQAA